MTQAKLDNTGETICMDPATGICRIDGIPAFRIVAVKGQSVRLQFADDDKMRSHYRGTRYVEITLDVLFQKIIELSS
jgi:hypothetical protein